MITQDRLKELLHYNPETGIFTWIKKWGKKPAGRQAGYLDKKGYLYVMLDRKFYKLHRLAWLYVYGNFPNDQIDHRDEIKTNNRIGNLRDVHQSINQWNKSSSRSDNKICLLGVSPHGNGWRAVVHIKGKQISLGTFQDPFSAHNAYLHAKSTIHKGYDQ